MLSEEEKVIQFYKRFIEAEEQELEWMYKEDEEYYRDSIEQKELLIKGWRNILNLITKQQKENEKYKYLYQKALDNTIKSDRENIELKKQIDLMVKFINNQNIIMIENEITCIRNIYEIVGFDKKEEDIKQYFETKAKEKGE